MSIVVDARDVDSPPEAEEGSVLPLPQVRAVIEALVFASPQPITPKEIGRVLQGVPRETWQAQLAELQADYGRDERGLQIVEIAGGFQVTTRPEYNDWVRELLDPRTPTRRVSSVRRRNSSRRASWVTLEPSMASALRRSSSINAT